MQSHDRVVVLVEGESDVAALTQLPGVRDHGTAEVVEIRAMGGATNVRQQLDRAVREDGVRRILGLCDVAEARFYQRALADQGFTADSPSGLAAYGFHCCVVDLEDELIRALGPDGALAVLADLGLMRRFGTFRTQPFWRDQGLHAQLKRFAGTTSGRKATFARALTRALPPDRLPGPLARLIDQIGRAVRERTRGPLARFDGADAPYKPTAQQT